MNKTDMLKSIQEYNFAAYDMLLYLDTHPDDKKAFDIFKTLVEKTKTLIKSYEAEFGPLTAKSAAGFSSFRWLESPWPWEKEGNA
jgi:spore coat protein JB